MFHGVNWSYLPLISADPFSLHSDIGEGPHELAMNKDPWMVPVSLSTSNFISSRGMILHTTALEPSLSSSRPVTGPRPTTYALA